jgi:hypothetical protein
MLMKAENYAESNKLLRLLERNTWSHVKWRT